MAQGDVLGLVCPVAPAPESSTASPDRRLWAKGDLVGARVSIVENGKHNATELLDALRSLLIAGYGAVPGGTFHKEVSGPIHEQDLGQLVAGSDVVLVGTAD